MQFHALLRKRQFHDPVRLAVMVAQCLQPLRFSCMVRWFGSVSSASTLVTIVRSSVQRVIVDVTVGVVALEALLGQTTLRTPR